MHAARAVAVSLLADSFRPIRQPARSAAVATTGRLCAASTTQGHSDEIQSKAFPCGGTRLCLQHDGGGASTDAIAEVCRLDAFATSLDIGSPRPVVSEV